MTEALSIAAGPFRAAVLPLLGGALSLFERDGQPLFRAASDGVAVVTDTSCFPIVPYVNRIRGGRFACDGREVTLAPNMPPDPSPLHGQGWLAPWTVEAQDAASVTLAYRHEAGEWPWTYDARLTWALDERGLAVTLSCRNRSPERMPCGLALHPYYPCDADTILDTGVSGAWTVDGNVLPVDHVPATGRYDLRDRRVCAQGLDNGFDGWTGSARITWPGRPAALELSSPGQRFFQLYSPAGGGVFVAEPVQHANAALNAPQAEWEALGLVLLGEGEKRTLSARFDAIVGEG